MSDYKYVIIGGTTKAATTSLFFYLKSHPEIIASNIKETRYFLDADYPLRAKQRFDGIKNVYDEYFDTSVEGVRLEATPDYLYSLNTPKVLFDTFGKDLKLMFILREPINRLESWYKFGKQDSRIEKTESFTSYLNRMMEKDSSVNRSQPYMALEQGKYMSYLKKWFKYFDEDQISIIFFENLKSSPAQQVNQICKDLQIDPRFYDDYEFKVKNKSLSLKNPKFFIFYQKFVYQLVIRIHKFPRIHEFFRKIKRVLDRSLFNSESKENNENDLNESLKRRLVNFYRQDIVELSKKYELPDSWKNIYK